MAVPGGGPPPPAEPAHASGDGDSVDGDAACRRVLERLGSARGPLTLEQLHRSTRLGLLEIAGAVETLRDRGLVAVEREPAETVRLTGGGGEQPA